jgi:hypothetical protein
VTQLVWRRVLEGECMTTEALLQSVGWSPLLSRKPEHHKLHVQPGRTDDLALQVCQRGQGMVVDIEARDITRIQTCQARVWDSTRSGSVLLPCCLWRLSSACSGVSQPEFQCLSTTTFDVKNEVDALCL